MLDGDELVQTAVWRTPTDEGWKFPGDLLSKAFFGDIQWTDYEFTVDLMGVEGEVYGPAYLYFRSTDVDHFWNTDLAQFEIPPPGTGNRSVNTSVYENGKKRSLGGAPLRSLDGGKWYTARVKVHGTQIECSLHDGKSEVARVPNFQIQGHWNGKVGLGTTNASYRFKNIKVKALDQALCNGIRDIDWPTESGRDAEGTGEKTKRSESKPAVTHLSGATTTFDGKAIRLAGGWYEIGQELGQNRSDGSGHILLGNTKLAAYDLEFKCIVNEVGSFWVTFHRTGPADWSSFVIGDSGEHVLRSTCVGSDDKQILMRTPGRIRPGRWYDVLLKVNGHRVSCYLDHQLLFHHDALPSGSGRVGFGTRHTAARFRDIVISAPDGDPLWQGLPELAGLGKKEPLILSGSWRVDQKTNELIQSDVDGPSKILLHDALAPNFEVKFEARADAGAPEFRVFTHHGQFDFRFFRIGGNVAKENRAGEGDRQGRLNGGSGTLQVPRLELGRWHTVKVTVSGTDARCYLDDNEWFRGRIQPSVGLIGFGTWNTAARFRNITVSSFAGGVLREGLPDLPSE